MLDTKTLYAGSFQINIESGQLQNRTVTGSMSTLNSDVDYTYNNDNRLTKADAATGTDYQYTYDDVGNLTKEDDGTATYYGYDRAGELCWQGPNNGTNLARGCPSTPSGDTTVYQDPAGNSTGTDTSTSSNDYIGYNNRDQVTKIGGYSMGYRDLGNDLRMTAGNFKTFDGPLGTSAVDTGSGVTFYTRDPHGTVLNSHDTTGTRNYVTEFNGSVTALYNPSGSAVGSYTYSPYGKTHANTETGTTQAGDNPFRYIGGYQGGTCVGCSGSDGPYKLGARYYDTHAHFTQPDPAAPGTGNYAYTNGDPINTSNPSGLCAFADIFCYAETAERYIAPVLPAAYSFAAVSLGSGFCITASLGACAVVAIPLAAGAVAGIYGSYRLGKGTYVP